MSTERPPVLDDRTVERLLTGRSGMDPELEHALGLVRSMGAGPAPRPTTALAELLATGFEPEPVPLPRSAPRRRRWAVRATAALTAAAASLLVAGTAQALPAPLQDGLGDLVSAITPFELPRARSVDDSSSPVPDRSTGTKPDQPVPTPAPSAPSSGTPVPGAGAAPSAPGGPSGAAPTTDRGAGARGTGAPARATVPDGSRAPVAPEQARSEPRRAVPEAPPSPRAAGASTVPPVSTASPGPAGTRQGRAGSPADASTAPETRGAGDTGR